MTIVCFMRCWACQMGEHYDPPRRHTWMGEEDVEHEGRASPSSPEDWAQLDVERPCACWCAK